MDIGTSSHKIGRQRSHFVFGFFGVEAAPPASSPSSSSTTVPPGVPHGGMFELHHILEDGITEDAAGVLGLPRWKWTAGLIEIYGHQRSIAGVTAVLSNLEDGEDREEDREGREGDREDRTGDRKGGREGREGYREDRTGDREEDREGDRGQRGWQRGGQRGGQIGWQRGGHRGGQRGEQRGQRGVQSGSPQPGFDI